MRITGWVEQVFVGGGERKDDQQPMKMDKVLFLSSFISDILKMLLLEAGGNQNTSVFSIPYQFTQRTFLFSKYNIFKRMFILKNEIISQRLDLHAHFILSHRFK